MKRRSLLALALGLAAAAHAQTTVPSQVSFNARLVDTTGAPVSGVHRLQFTLYTAPTGGTNQWQETYSTANFASDGTISLGLGSSTALTPAILSGAQLYLEISVDGTVLSPRVSVVSVPYAIRASTAGSADTAATLGTLTPAQVQQRVTGTCASGSAVSAVNADGTVGCQPVAAAVDLTIGRLATNAGTSCKDIKTRMPSAMDGLYLIDVDGTGGAPPFEAYCDMTRDGGGWTLIMRVWYQSGLAGNANGFGSPHEANSSYREGYKLPDATVNALTGTAHNFDILVDETYHNTAYSNGNHEYVIVRNYTGTYTYTGVVAESTTPTVFESYRAHDNAIAWRGRLQCGVAGTYGINCDTVLSTPNPLGAPNPQGGLGCLLQLGTATNAGWHQLYQGANNTDTYIYICNGAQHTSSMSNVHRWWVR